MYETFKMSPQINQLTISVILINRLTILVTTFILSTSSFVYIMVFASFFLSGVNGYSIPYPSLRNYDGHYFDTTV